MRFILLTLLTLSGSSAFSKDAKQGVYIPPNLNNPALKKQVVRMTLGDNERTAIVKYKYGSITRLVFPTDTNTASCEVDSKIVKVENPKTGDESLKGQKVFFRRISLKTHEGSAKNFTTEDDRFLESELIRVICTYERFNVVYERVIFVKLSAENGFGVVFFEHPQDRFYNEFRSLRLKSIREITYGKNGQVIGDRKKDLVGPPAPSKKRNNKRDRFPILIVPVDESKPPYWKDEI